MSPYLFSMGMEYFSTLLGLMGEDLSFHPNCKRVIKLTHLLFVDYLLIVFKADINSVQSVKHAFSTFFEASDLSVNLDKRCVDLTGIDPATKCDIYSV